MAYVWSPRSRQPKSSTDFGRRPERLPAGKIEFAPIWLRHLQNAISENRLISLSLSLSSVPPYRQKWSLLHLELDLLRAGEKGNCLLGRFPADSEPLSCPLVSPIRLLPTPNHLGAEFDKYHGSPVQNFLIMKLTSYRKLDQYSVHPGLGSKIWPLSSGVCFSPPSLLTQRTSSLSLPSLHCCFRQTISPLP